MVKKKTIDYHEPSILYLVKINLLVKRNESVSFYGWETVQASETLMPVVEQYLGFSRSAMLCMPLQLDSFAAQS